MSLRKGFNRVSKVTFFEKMKNQIFHLIVSYDVILLSKGIRFMEVGKQVQTFVKQKNYFPPSRNANLKNFLILTSS